MDKEMATLRETFQPEEMLQEIGRLEGASEEQLAELRMEALEEAPMPPEHTLRATSDAAWRLLEEAEPAWCKRAAEEGAGPQDVRIGGGGGFLIVPATLVYHAGVALTIGNATKMEDIRWVSDERKLGLKVTDRSRSTDELLKAVSGHRVADHGPTATEAAVGAIHGLWCGAWDAWLEAGAESPPPPHPWRPVVAAWLTRHKLEEIAPWGGEAANHRRASLPRLDNARGDDVSMLPIWSPTREGTVASSEDQLLLPLDPAEVIEDVHLISPFLLRLFDTSARLAGISPGGGGHGAPRLLRMFVEALTALPKDWRDGEWHAIRLPILRRHEADEDMQTLFDPSRTIMARAPIKAGPRDSVERRLYSSKWGGWWRDWEQFRKELEMLYQLRIPMGEHHEGSVVIATELPTSPQARSIQLAVRTPRSARHGARVDLAALRRYGCQSNRRYRAYLVACLVLARTAGRAEVGDGLPLTRYRHQNGSDGPLVANVTGRRLQMVKPYTLEQWCRAAGIGEYRMNQSRIREDLKQMEADGCCHVEWVTRDAVRLWGPHLPSHRAMLDGGSKPKGT